MKKNIFVVLLACSINFVFGTNSWKQLKSELGLLKRKIDIQLNKNCTYLIRLAGEQSGSKKII